MDPDDAELVIFDLDGTLVRLDVDWQAFRDKLAEFVPEDVLCDGPDRPATWTLEQLADRGDMDTHRRVLEVLRSWELAGASRSRLHPVGTDILHRLDGDRPLALVTNNTRAAAQEALRRHGLRPRFDMVVALEDVDRHKPHPDGLQRVLDRFDADPASTLFIGDGAKDQDAAQAAGVSFLDVDGE